MDRRDFLVTSAAMALASSGLLHGKETGGRMPALFVSHGSPMNAVADNPYVRDLKAMGRELPRPEAILVVSAHWYPPEWRVTTAEEPETVHDFFGFPDALYDMEYRAGPRILDSMLR